MKKNFDIKISKSKISKYVLVSLISFGLVYFIKDLVIDFNSELYVFILNFLILIGIALGIYALFTYKIDKDAHVLINSIIKEMRTKIKK